MIQTLPLGQPDLVAVRVSGTLSAGDVAMVGEKKWQDWIATLVNPVKKGEVRYFDLADRDAALGWLGYGVKGV
jgi:hypothetical protein